MDEAFGALEDNAPDGGMVHNPVAAAPIVNHVDAANAANVWAPDASLDEPAATTTTDEPYQSTTAQQETPKPKRRSRLTVKVTQLEHTKADPIIWFDVHTSLPRFRTQTFKDIRRTHHELKRFANHLASANPECFVPALPPATSSWPRQSPQHDAQIVANIQKWFDRITRSPLLVRDEEFLYFVEASFGYTPVVKIKPPATGLARKMIKQLAPPPDDVDELREFRPVAKLVYQYATESRYRLQKVSKSRRALAGAMQTFGAALGGEDGLGEKGLARCIEASGETEKLKAMLEEGTVGDTLEIVAADAFIIKETLTNRHILMRDLIRSQDESRAKHQQAMKLKGATNISPARVDDAITQLEDAAQLERRITSAVRRVSDNLVVEKRVALARMESDIMGQIQQLTLRVIDAERRTLNTWEQLRPEIRAQATDGGLSRLGRPAGGERTRGNRRSQTFFGDEWSGDRQSRAADLAPPPEAKPEVLDARTAASLLSESIF